MPDFSSSKRHICHLTVLNPARHSRIFFKMARSQVAAGYQVTIIGQDPAQEPYFENGVRIVPTGVFSRKSWGRLRAPGRIQRLAIVTGADIFQVHTPELLPAARRIVKALPQARIVYDMHEDYRQNILYGGYYPAWLRRPLSRRVRRAEQQFADRGGKVIYAEECFEGLLQLDVDAYRVVRNKFLVPEESIAPLEFSNPGWPLLLYSGTIAESWGVMDALRLWGALQALAPVRLCIAGHTHDAALVQKINEFVASSGFGDRFFLAGGDTYLPYPEMVGWLSRADVGLAMYHLRENIRERIPTKFYEFMAFGKPVLFSANPTWEHLNQKLRFGQAIAPPNFDLISLSDWIQQAALKKNPSNYGPEDYGWASEAEAMLSFLDEI